MLNEHLSEFDLQSSLKEFLEPCNFLFSQLEPEKEVSIFANKKILANLHHSMNIEKYSKKSFRQGLLIGAPDNEIVEFAQSRNVKHTINQSKTVEFRKNLADFMWGNNDETRNFVKIFGYPDYLVPQSTKKTETEEYIVPTSNPFKQLKDYQANIVFRSINNVEIANKKFLIHMPTGAGKTRVAMEVVSHFLNNGKDRQVVWLADRSELCEQAIETFLNVWSHLGKNKIKIHRLWGKASIPREITESGLVVVMYQKIRVPIKNKQFNLKADLIVLDEAHNAIANTYSDVVDGLKSRTDKQTRIMGLTATPGRGTNDIHENRDLAGFFNDVIVGIDVEIGVIEYLQRKNILAKCHREALNTNIQYSLSEQQWKQLSKNFEQEFPDGLLKDIANDQRRNLKIIIKLRELAEECERVLVFCGSIEQSKLLAGFMHACGYRAAHVDGSSPINYRKDVVNEFKKGNIKLIFNYGIFTAGFDVPKIDAVVIARPTTSIVLYGQMIGRGMRGLQIGGTRSFRLVDVVDDIATKHGFLDRVHEYFTEYWETE